MADRWRPCPPGQNAAQEGDSPDDNRRCYVSAQHVSYDPTKQGANQPGADNACCWRGMLILVPGLRKQPHLYDGDSCGGQEPASVQHASAHRGIKQVWLRDAQFPGGVVHLLSTPLHGCWYGLVSVSILAHHR